MGYDLKLTLDLNGTISWDFGTYRIYTKYSIKTLYSRILQDQGSNVWSKPFKY